MRARGWSPVFGVRPRIQLNRNPIMPSYDALQQQDQEIYAAVAGEMQRQVEGVELIPSENYISAAVMETMASVFNNRLATEAA